MARLTKETARRSLNALLDALGADAVVEVVKNADAPPAGIAAVVRIEITSPEPADTGEEKGKDDANVSGQRGTNVDGQRQRGRRQASQGSS